MNRILGIKRSILIPLAIAFLILLGIVVGGTYWLQQRNINQYAQTRLQNLIELFPTFLAKETELLQVQLDLLEDDTTLQTLFVNDDKEGLFATVHPIFAQMRDKYRVTRFYIINPDATTYLKLHDTLSEDDKTDRFTILKAVETEHTAAGIELGRLGAFTLRAVHPWYHQADLVGYLELGMPIAHLVPILKHTLQADLLFVVDKQYLEQSDWGEGESHQDEWDEFDNFVAIERTLSKNPTGLNQYLNQLTPSQATDLLPLSAGYTDYLVGAMPLTEANGRHVGYIIALTDVTAQKQAVNTFVAVVIWIALIIGGGLMAFFYIYVGRIDTQLTDSQQNLLNEIEERTQAEQQLRKLSRAVEQSPASVVITNIEGDIEYVNPGFTRVTGYSYDEAIGQNPRILKSGYHTSDYYKNLWDTLNDGREWQGDLCNRKKNGELYWEFGSLSPVRNRTGNITHFVAVKEDITEQKRVSDELEQYRNHLEELVADRTEALTLANDELNQEITERKRVEAELVRHRHHLEELVAERTHRLEIVASVSERLSSILSLNQLLTELVNQIKINLGYYQAHVYLLDESGERLVVVAANGKIGEVLLAREYAVSLHSESSFVARTARTGKLIAVNNLRDLPDWQPNSLMPDSYAKVTVPIMIEGHVGGVLVVHHSHINGFDSSDIDLLRSLASHVSVDITNVKLFEQTQTSLAQTENLYRYGQRMMAATNLSELVAVVVESVNIPVINRALLLTPERNENGDIDSMVLVATWHNGKGTVPRALGTKYSAAMSTVVNMSLTTEPSYFNNVQTDPRVSLEMKQAAQERNIKALIVMPLVNHGEQKAVLMLMAENPYSFTEHELHPYFSLVAQLAVGVENQQLLQQTQQRAAELADAKEELLKLNADKDKFFSILAHDLKGPFMPLLGNAELLPLMVDTNSADELREMSRSIYRSAQAIYNLLENLLQWSRLQMGRMPFNPVMFDVRNLIDNNLDLLAENALSKQVAIHSDLTESVQVYADQHMVDTVLRNLIANALKFTPTSGKIIVKALPYPQDTRFVQLCVCDNGVGIAPENLAKLFKIELHHTTLGTSNEKGTGLGLIMCQEMVQTNGGKIWVESELNQGTIIHFTLPYYVDNPSLSG